MKNYLFYLLMSILPFQGFGQLLSEGFEGATFPPAGWTTFIGTNGVGTEFNWGRSTTTPYEGAGHAFVRYENVTGGIAEDWMVTPAIDLSDYENAELTFYTRQDFNLDWESNYYVKVSTLTQSTHADFVDVATWTELTLNTTYNVYEQKTVDLSAYDGQTIFIAFVMTNDDGDSWYVDNVVVNADELSGGEGCLEAENGQWPFAIYTPNCSGELETITAAGWTGEYSMVEVTSGTEYIFSVSDPTYFITIGDEEGTSVLASGAGSVTWTAPADQSVRFYTHFNSDCEWDEETFLARLIRCGDIMPPPVNDDCADAIALSCGDTENGSTSFATDSGGNISPDVFYTFTGTGTEELVTVSLCGSSYDTVVRIFSDCTLTEEITMNDDSDMCTEGGGLQSEVSFTSDGTSTYVILVEGFESIFGEVETGDYTINVSCEALEEGCLEAENGQFPLDSYVPGCVGIAETITDNGWTGEYSMVDVTSGTEYIFSVSDPTYFITIGDEEGTIVLASGTGSVTWTAPADQSVRFYTHFNSDCEWDDEIIVERNIQCGDPIVIEEPDFTCFQGDGLSPMTNTMQITSQNILKVADDFVVAEGTLFTVQQVRAYILSSAEISSVKLNFRSDNGGTPGVIEDTQTVVPSSQRVVGSLGGYLVYEVNLDLPTALEFEAGTHWLQPEAENLDGSVDVWWVLSSEGSNGAFTKFSLDSGVTWTDVEGSMQALFFISGECDTIEEPEGCLEAENGQFPTTTFVPSCNGSVENITTLGWAGEYSLIQATAGTEYSFSVSDPTYFITIGDETGTTVFASGTGSVTWTAPADQLVRFYTHLNSDCEWDSETFLTRSIQCGDILPPPANDDCADAIALSCGDSETGNTTFATDSGGNGAPDVFYTFTGNGTEELVTVSLCGSSYDTVVRIFSDCTLTEEITMNDDSDMCTGGDGLQSEVSFVSDGTSTYVILVEGFESIFGGAAVGDFEINITCGEVPPPPTGCEDFVVLSNNLENGLFFGGDTSQHLAIDIPVADEVLTIYGIEPTVVDVATSFEFIIYDDAGGLPGAEIDTRSGSIVSSVVTGNNFGFDFIKYTVAFDSPLVLEANTTYWIEVISDAAGWESTSAPGSVIGNSDVFYNDNVGEGVWTSTGGDEFVFNFICEELGVSDMSSFDFKYYPNPVNDVLNISAKKKVESISVFNLAGQTVIADAKVSNGQINVSTLTPGTYVFRALLEGGQIETFKIIKK